jgi:hypothetical protein
MAGGTPGDPGDGGGSPAHGTTGHPLFRFVVGGVDHDIVPNRVVFTNWTVYRRGGNSELHWSVCSRVLPTARPDAYLGQAVEWYTDEGSEVLRFAGDCVDAGPWMLRPGQGWVRSYVAYGLAWRADLVPAVNPTDGTDRITWNQRRGQSGYRAALAGRSIGAMVRYLLEAPENAAALDGLGIGNYTAVPTTAAAAHATISGGAVTVVIDSGGAGYGSGTAPAVILVGGGGTYSSATASLTDGAVSGISVSGSTGYTSAPEVWISPLPLVTLQDLAVLAFVPPYPVSTSGSGLFQAVRAILSGSAPNHDPKILPDGTIRVYDLRVFTTHDLEMGTDLVDVGGVQISHSIQGCASRVIVKGGPDVVAQLLTTAGSPATLAEYFDHDGLTNAQAKTAFRLRDYLSPENCGIAVFTANRSGTTIGSLTTVSHGHGYRASSSYSVSFTGGGGSGATASFTTDSVGKVASTTVVTAGTGYTSSPTVVVPSPDSSGVDSGTCSCSSATEVLVTSANVNRSWATNFWDQSATGRLGTIFLHDSSVANVDTEFSAGIVSCTSLTAGGTSTLTLDRELPQTTYDSYRVVGSAGGGSIVYRRYKPVASAVQGALIDYFPFAVAYSSSDGSAATMTRFPTAGIRKGRERYCAQLVTDPDLSTFLLPRPVVTYTGVQLGEGDTVPAGNLPDSVEVLAAVVRGNLGVTVPPDDDETPQYEGTLYTVEGVERTLYVPVPNWVDKGQVAHMTEYAEQLLDAVKDTRIEGSVPLLGWDATWYTPGQALTLSGNGYGTQWDTEPMPAVSCEVAIVEGAAVPFRTMIGVSNQRGALSPSAYERPIPRGWSLGAGLEGFSGVGKLQWAGYAGGLGGSAPSLSSFQGTMLPAGLGHAREGGPTHAERVAAHTVNPERQATVGDAPSPSAVQMARNVIPTPSASQRQDAMRGTFPGQPGGATPSAAERYDQDNPARPFAQPTGRYTPPSRPAPTPASPPARSPAAPYTPPAPTPAQRRPGIMPGSAGLAGAFDSPFASTSISTAQVKPAPYVPMTAGNAARDAQNPYLGQDEWPMFDTGGGG